MVTIGYSLQEEYNVLSANIAEAKLVIVEDEKTQRATDVVIQKA